MNEDMMERIKRLISEKHLSQTKIAKELGIHYTTLWRRLNGARDLNVDFLVNLARVLGTSAAFLLGETEDPSPDLSQARSGEETPPRVSSVTLDLEVMIKDLVYEHPDLAIGFRDTRENWGSLSENDKESIADALMLTFGSGGCRPGRLKKESRHGKV
ncbi:MAG: helix-turn-helix domain-containing protein [Fretibacterium sp.]|nr:helix-turn-helix domain-containing protein [Fretibacterium sp.]